MARRYAIVDEDQKRQALAKHRPYLNRTERKLVTIRGSQK